MNDPVGLPAEIGSTEKPANDSRRNALVKAGITFAAVLALLLLVDLRQVFRALDRIPPALLLMVLVFLSADRVAMGIKWWQLVNGAGGRMRMRDAIRIYFQSGFAALLLPTSVGGEVLRGFLGQQAGVPPQLLVASMVVEKLVAALSNVLLAALGAIYIVDVTHGRAASILWMVAISAVLLAAALVLAANRRAHQWVGSCVRRWIPERAAQLLNQLSVSVVDYRQRKAVLATNLLLAIAEHFLQFTALYLLARGLGVNFGLLPFLAVTAVVMLVRRTAGFLESWWLAETSVVVLYSLFGVPQALSVGLAVALWATSIVAALPGGYLLYRQGLSLGNWWSRRGQPVSRRAV